MTSANYNPDSSLKSLLNGSTPALSQNFQYTPRLQLCRMTTLTSGTLPTSCTDTQNVGNIMDRGYDFHAGNGDNGNVFTITNYRDTTRSQAFTYDALNRLTSGWSSANTGTYSWGENYSIDAWSNLQISPMGTKAHGGTFQLSGNAQNRPTGMAYDAAGNLMSYVSSTYIYDQENRLSSTAGMSYTYDGNGERVLKSNSGTGAAVKRYWSMGGNTLAEGDGTGNLTAEYIYFGGKRIARIDLPANTVHYYLSDHLGSTSIVASAVGAVEEESDYYPFGTEVIVTGPGVNELKFTGKRRDTESQLDYFGARYYSNGFGRFITPDWAAKIMSVPYAKFSNPQSLNLYNYVWNNPLSRSDPDGHYTCADSKKCNSANDKAFQSRLDNLKAAQGTFKQGSDAYKQIGAILSAYGSAGDTKTADGKTVSIGFSGRPDTGGVTKPTDKGTIGVSLASNFSAQAAGNNIGSTVLVGHEGQHVVDGAPAGTARFGSEMRAESVTQTILNGLAGTSIMPSSMNSFSIRGITTWQRDAPYAYDAGAALKIAIEDYKQDVKNDPK